MNVREEQTCLLDLNNVFLFTYNKMTLLHVHCRDTTLCIRNKYVNRIHCRLFLKVFHIYFNHFVYIRTVASKINFLIINNQSLLIQSENVTKTHRQDNLSLKTVGYKILISLLDFKMYFPNFMAVHVAKFAMPVSTVISFRSSLLTSPFCDANSIRLSNPLVYLLKIKNMYIFWVHSKYCHVVNFEFTTWEYFKSKLWSPWRIWIHTHLIHINAKISKTYKGFTSILLVLRYFSLMCLFKYTYATLKHATPCLH